MEHLLSALQPKGKVETNYRNCLLALTACQASTVLNALLTPPLNNCEEGTVILHPHFPDKESEE